ncbi:RteC domain-containing protein [Mucilaginibacter sp. MD40]|uniref:RteC domain-containing protein n=1 Tax=Mucilaginibacter sp. MD40 TaxID=2029590 RepID=UPI001303F435|nr:RteC domain-containing protein [Mucilaginibacter sp. MD40]
MADEMRSIQKDVENQLNTLDASGEVERFRESLTIIDSGLKLLNEHVAKTGFAELSEEVLFFKTIYPPMAALRIEACLRYNLYLNRPIGTKDGLNDYLKENLKGLQSFILMNFFYYQYYKRRDTEMDYAYFTRSSNSILLPITEYIPNERDTSTPMSGLFAKFIAYEAMQVMLVKELDQSDHLSKEQDPAERNMGLRWTGEVVNLVELAYGIWLTGQLNNGNASLNQIVTWLESNLQVKIGIAQRRFTEISARKRLTITHFIDRMRAKIMEKADASNE